MKILWMPLIGLSSLGVSAAECTQAEATEKMKEILESDEYRDVIAAIGAEAETDVRREATKRGLGSFGGRVGRVASGVMQSQDNDKANNAATDVASSVKRVTTAMNDAGDLIEEKDYNGACRLYERVEEDIAAMIKEKDGEQSDNKKKRRFGRG